MTNRTLGIILIAVAVILAILGINTYQDASAGLEIGDLEISATDEGSQTTAFLYLGLAVVALIGGLRFWKK